MVVSVIIPVLNGEAFISRTLRALDRQTYPPDSFEVIVVDNGSTDRTRERVAAHIKTSENRSEKTSGKNRAEKTSENSFEKKSPDGSDDPVNGPVDGPVDGSVNSPVDGPADGPEVKLIVNSGPRNPYLSRNLGASEAAGDLLVFLDATCTPDVRWLEEGVRLIEEGADLVGGHIRFTFSPALSLGEWYDSLTFVNIRQYIEESGSTSGGNLFVRREVWEATGPFPETMRSGGDTYWTRNAGRKGYQLRYGEKAAVSYPARGFRAVVRKSCRVGRGHVQAWHREGRSARSVLAEIITTFSPPSLSGLKRLIGERGTPEMNRYALQLWCISWLCKVSMALGRAGAFFSVYFPDYIPDRFSFYGKSVEKKSVYSEGPERKSADIESPERESRKIESEERKSMGMSPARLQKGTIAFLYYTYYPVTGGASVHGYNLARELSRLGYRLLKINGRPDGFTEKRHPAELWRVLRESDLVYVRMDYFPNLRNLAGLAALLSGKKVVVELNSPSDELHLHGRGRLFIRLVDRVASRLLKRADAVIAVSEGVKTYGETALGLTNIHVIENGGEVFSSEDLSPSAAVKQRVEDLRKKYRKLVVWAGTPNQLQSMEWLQQTILGTREKAEANDSGKAVFLMLMNDRDGSKIMSEKMSMAGENLVIFRDLPRDDVRFLIAEADIGLAFYDEYAWSRWGFYLSSLKIVEYLNNGLLTITNVEGTPVQRSARGFLKADHPQQAVEAIRRFSGKEPPGPPLRTWADAAGETAALFERILADEHVRTGSAVK